MPASIKHLTDTKLNLTSLLARWKDGLYYTAAVVKCDKTNKKCLVCFEDGSEIWVNNRDVHIQLSLDQLNEDEDIVCCICDDGNSEPPNEIILCDVCNQGYHQKCHNPPVDSSTIDESEDSSDHKDWFCATCSYILNQSNRAKLSANASAQQQQQESPDSQQQQKQQPQQQQQKQQPQQQQAQAKQTQQPQPQPKQQPQPQQQQQQPPQPVAATPASISQPVQKQPAVKAKQQSPASQQHQKTTVGPIKPTIISTPVQKQAPYYPLSNQARVAATTSTAALASLTASSALVVGSSAGRTKQDLVNQSNRSSQRQRPVGSNVEVISPPVKHAVRKSSVNFVMPVRQSALPTATRSVLPNSAPSAKLPHLTVASTSTSTTSPQPPTSTITTTVSPTKNNSNNKSHLDNIKEKQQAALVSKLVTWTAGTQVTPMPPNNSSSKATTTTLTGGRSSDSVKESTVPSSTNSTGMTNNSGGNKMASSTVSNNNSNLSSSSSTAASSPPNSDVSNNAKSAQPTVIVSVESNNKIGST